MKLSGGSGHCPASRTTLALAGALVVPCLFCPSPRAETLFLPDPDTALNVAKRVSGAALFAGVPMRLTSRPLNPDVNFLTFFFRQPGRIVSVTEVWGKDTPPIDLRRLNRSNNRAIEAKDQVNPLNAVYTFRSSQQINLFNRMSYVARDTGSTMTAVLARGADSTEYRAQVHPDGTLTVPGMGVLEQIPQETPAYHSSHLSVLYRKAAEAVALFVKGFERPQLGDRRSFGDWDVVVTRGTKKHLKNLAAQYRGPFLEQHGVRGVRPKYSFWLMDKPGKPVNPKLVRETVRVFGAHRHGGW